MTSVTCMLHVTRETKLILECVFFLLFVERNTLFWNFNAVCK